MYPVTSPAIIHWLVRGAGGGDPLPAPAPGEPARLELRLPRPRLHHCCQGITSRPVRGVYRGRGDWGNFHHPPPPHQNQNTKIFKQKDGKKVKVMGKGGKRGSKKLTKILSKLEWELFLMETVMYNKDLTFIYVFLFIRKWAIYYYVSWCNFRFV